MEQHGKSGTSEYNAWNDMKKRCYNKNYKQYKDWGERGITVCDSWVNSFSTFLKDMGEKPSKNYSLDRLDNNGNYTPANCRWVDRQTQARNRRKLKDTPSQYKGLCRIHSNEGRYSYWVATVTNNYKRYKKNFKCEREAAMWWDSKALEEGYEFSTLNFPCNNLKKLNYIAIFSVS